ncbi:MAG TPA: type II CAAX endopeptidase family protein [Gemmatimonadales bacterium]|nr:type II CAAX endopeptidase family protein [Gemmatimonadales bacterium]
MSPIANLFWNARERRLRAGWRLLVFLVMLLAVAVVEGRVRAGLAGRLPDLYEGLARALVFALLIAAVLYLAGRVLDHRRMSDYGFHFGRNWWTDLGFGLVLGALLLFGILAMELAMGWVNVTGSFAPSTGQPFVATILVGVVAVAAVAFGEEASYRGYPIKNLAEGIARTRWGMIIAVVIPAVYFGLAHTTNENATWLSTFNIVIFGLLFGTGYVLTGELALPIGLHFGWDFVQGFVFGVVAEGKQYGSVLVLADDSSARLWTGRPYGVEGGLMGTAAFIAGFLATFAWARSQHRTALQVTRQHPVANSTHPGSEM